MSEPLVLGEKYFRPVAATETVQVRRPGRLLLGLADGPVLTLFEPVRSGRQLTGPRRPAKKAWSRLAAASARTPATIGNSWLRRGSAPRL